MFRIYCENKTEFYQWDKDQKLIVEDATIEEVHFCNGTSDCALCTTVYDYEGKRVVDVPNIILQTAKTFKAFGYTSGATLVEDKFRVNARSKPADYVYTETEIKNWDELLEAIPVVDIALSADSNNAIANSAVVKELTKYITKEEIGDINSLPIVELNNYYHLAINDFNKLAPGIYIYTPKWEYDETAIVVSTEREDFLPTSSGDLEKAIVSTRCIIDTLGFRIREKISSNYATELNTDWVEKKVATTSDIDNAIGDTLEGGY